MKKKILAVFMTATMMLSMAACGSTAADTSASGDSAAAENSVAAGSSAASSGASAAIGTAKASADKMVLATTLSTDGLNPFTSIHEYQQLVFETLGFRETVGGEMKNLLMSSYKQVDDSTYDVTIYKDIKDSQGNAITAADVVFSYQECLRLGQQSQLNFIKSVKAKDDYTVEFNLGDNPTVGEFETAMTLVPIVSQKAYEASGDEFATTAVGTGPYTVSAFTAGVETDFTARDDYWAKGDEINVSSQQAPIKNIQLKTITESSQITMALETGDADVTYQLSSQDAPNFEKGGMYADQYTVETVPNWNSYVLYPNVSKDSPLSDENLRKAVFSAIDINLIASTIQGGDASPAYGMGTDLLADYNSDWESLHPSFDLDAAKKYMAQSAYPNGCELTLIYPPDSYIADMGVILQSELSEIGIKLTLKEEQFSNYLTDEGNSTAWDFECVNLTAYDYVTSIWRMYFDAEANGMGTSKNFIKDDQLQKLVSTAESVDGHTQENVDTAWKYIMDNAYCDPLIVPDMYVVYNNTILNNFKFSGLGYFEPQAFSFK